MTGAVGISENSEGKEVSQQELINQFSHPGVAHFQLILEQQITNSLLQKIVELLEQNKK